MISEADVNLLFDRFRLPEIWRRRFGSGTGRYSDYFIRLDLDPRQPLSRELALLLPAQLVLSPPVPLLPA